MLVTRDPVVSGVVKLHDQQNLQALLTFYFFHLQTYTQREWSDSLNIQAPAKLPLSLSFLFLGYFILFIYF